MKKKNFSDEEMEFLFKKIERGTFIIEKERIEIVAEDEKFVSKNINELDYRYVNTSRNLQKITEKKALILKAITECDDFSFESYGEYGYQSDVTLVTYNLIPESDELYLARLKTEGGKLIILERLKLIRKSRKEKRVVLFEKFKPKRKKPLKIFHQPDIICEVHNPISLEF